MIRGLKHFQFRGTDVIVFHVLDPDEIEFPFERATRFEDLETEEEVMAVPAVVRAHYLQAMGDFIERYRRELGGRRHRLPAARHEAAARARASRLICPLARGRCEVVPPAVEGSVSFLSPLFLIGAAAAAVPILLHLLKRQPEARVKFAAIRLLRNAPVEHNAAAAPS